MTTHNLLNSLVENGTLNPKQMMRALLGNSKENPVDVILTSMVDTMFNNLSDTEKKELFIEDPRKSEKQKAVSTLIEKSASSFVQGLPEKDLNLLFDMIQAKKDK